MGDPAGVGPEVIAKVWAEGGLSPAFVIGDTAILKRAIRVVEADLELRTISKPSEAAARPGNIDLLPVSRLSDDLPFGRVDARAGAAAYDYVETAIRLALGGEIGAVVTAPLNKEALKLAGIDFPGHTEILAAKSGTTDFGMMLVSDNLRVLLVSIHVPLIEAIRLVTVAAELKAIRLAHRACRDFGIARPRIAVAGLNPHAGENGLFGREDLEVIKPAVCQAQREGIKAIGPLPGDTVFMRARRREFDVVVAQYHDQGLIPIKYLGIELGVNITVGLPFIRTSVDHGTAFDIAGTGRAEHTSLRSAFRMAEQMMAARAAAK
jgi:4-hydroxythreonine-4-phosphate dehydrogenase